MKRIGLFTALFLLCFLTSCEEISAQTKEQSSGVITVSGASFDMQNQIGAVSHTFEEIITGAPSTVSIVVQGCMRGGTCETIDTYTTVANAIRKPGSTSPYDYHHVTASWTGGTSPTVKVAKLGTLARAGGGDAGGATSLTGDVTGTTDANTVSTVGTSSAGNVHNAEVAANAATNLNTVSTIVKRDGSGNFVAGTITAALTGNASTATALAGNGSNCTAGSYPLGVDASGNAEGCTVDNAGTVTHVPGALTSNAIIKGNGAADVQASGATIDSSNNLATSGSVTGGSLISSGSNGGVDLLEGTEAALTKAVGHGLLAEDSTAHRLKACHNSASCTFNQIVEAGADINTSDQVTVTHLAAALPVAQGGTALASGTSGGVLGYTASGTLASSGALTSNVLVKGGGAGVTPTNSSITDNGTTVSTAEPIATSAAGAGAFVATAGVAQGHATASTVTIEAPAAVTAYEIVLPGAAATGVSHLTNAAGVVTQSISAVVAADTDTSIAHTGVDINTSHQVTATHLAAALPVNQGGTGTTSTLTGLMRGSASTMTAAELSGDCATSGSNLVTCTQLNGANFLVNSSGLPTKIDGITTAGQGVDIVQCITSAKVETGADASVLSCTPASAVGGYEVCVSMDVSAANTATLGWTATWTNTKTNANAPTNMALFQMGVAAPALTFTAAANNSYYSCVPIGVSAAGTAIVVKTTFSGTSIAYNVSAWIKRAI